MFLALLQVVFMTKQNKKHEGNETVYKYKNSSNKTGILFNLDKERVRERILLTHLWNPWAAFATPPHPHPRPRSHRLPPCDACGSPCRCRVPWSARSSPAPVHRPLHPHLHRHQHRHHHLQLCPRHRCPYPFSCPWTWISCHFCHFLRCYSCSVWKKHSIISIF